MPDYSPVMDLCTRDELGQLFIEATQAGDTDLANALRETIKQRKNNAAPHLAGSAVRKPMGGKREHNVYTNKNQALA